MVLFANVSSQSLSLLETLFPYEILERREKSPGPSPRQVVSFVNDLTLKVVGAALAAFKNMDFAALEPNLDPPIGNTQGFLLYMLTKDERFRKEIRTFTSEEQISFELLQDKKISQKMAFLFRSCLLRAEQKAKLLEENTSDRTSDAFCQLVNFLEDNHPDLETVIQFARKRMLTSSLSLLQAEAEMIRPIPRKKLIEKMLHPVTVELPVKTERLPHPFPGKKIYKIMPVKIEEELHVSFFYQHEAIFQRLFETDGVICLKVSPEDTNQSFRYFFEAAFNSLMDHPPRDPKTPFIVFEGTTAPDCQPDLFVHKVENEIGFHTLINAATATEQQYPYLSREAREGLSFAVKNKSFHVDPTLLTGDLTLLQLPCPEALTSLLHFQKIAKEHSITSNDNSFFKLTRVYCSTIAQEGMI